MKCYMAVTPDEYELPLFVTDSIKELSEYYGISETTIFSSIKLKKNGKRSGRKFVKVIINEKRGK